MLIEDLGQFLDPLNLLVCLMLKRNSGKTQISFLGQFLDPLNLLVCLMLKRNSGKTQISFVQGRNGTSI